jgi:hypothetical protein
MHPAQRARRAVRRQVALRKAGRDPVGRELLFAEGADERSALIGVTIGVDDHRAAEARRLEPHPRRIIRAP